MLLGFVGAAKSSTMNTIASSISGAIVNDASVGANSSTHTTRVFRYDGYGKDVSCFNINHICGYTTYGLFTECKTAQGQVIEVPMSLFDVPGHVSITTIGMLIDGHIPNKTTLPEVSPKQSRCPVEFNKQAKVFIFEQLFTDYPG